jgi:peptidyl-prolyl cis-trans isomerase D
MVKPFEEAVKSLTIGQVSEPVKSQFGFHIIKLEDIKPGVTRPFSEVREQLEKQLQKEQAEEQFADQEEELARIAFENPYSLQVLTKTFDLEIKSTELFDRNGSNQKDSILSNQKLIDAAFGDDVLKEGLNSELIEIDKQHVIVLRLKDHKPAKAKPLAEIKEQIITAIKREKTGAEAKTLGKNLLDQIKQNGDPDELVKEHNLNWSPKHEVKRQDNNPKPAIISEAFKMGRPADNKAIYQGIELDNGDYALVAVLAIKDGIADEPPTEQTDQKSEDTPDPLQRTKEQQQMALGLSEFNQLVSGLKARAEIKEYLNKLKEEI